MASIKLDRKSKRVVFGIKKIPKNTEKHMRRALYLSGKLLRKSASDSILKKKSGRPYKYKGRTIRAGKYGESWANRSGKARRGLKFRVQGQDRLYFENSVDYVKYLEDPKIVKSSGHVAGYTKQCRKNREVYKTRDEKGF